MQLKTHALTRRGFILTGAAAVATTAAVVWPRGTARPGGIGPGDVRLVAGCNTAPLLGPSRPDVNVWSFGGQVPGPEIRVRQGDRLRVLVENDLPEETTVHWHGVRVPNAMDGVPHLTQAPIEPGGSFAYEFTAHDAGTFWYHPHQRSFEQVGRGLYGPLIVEERQPIRVDRDITWILDDWRLDGSGQISDDFGSPHDMTMSGRVGNTVTINGSLPQPFEVRAGERIRLRLINAANARIFGLDFGKHMPRIIAIDGQPVASHEAAGPVVLGPAMRIDLVLDMMEEPGSRFEIVDSFYKGLEYPLTTIAYTEASPLRRELLQASIELRPNPLAEPEFGGAERHEVVFGGGMMGMMGGGGMMGRGGMMGGSGMMGRGGMGGGGMMGGMAWTVNGVTATGHVLEPALTLPRGRTAVLDLKNDTAWWHPIHLHGHSFRVLSRNGKPTSHREWQDTILMPPNETAEIAFVADNPGDWMFHCHILEHQAAGMMATIRVAHS